MNKHMKAVAKLSSSSIVSIGSQIIKGKISAVLLGTDGVGILSQLKYLSNLLQFIFGMGFCSGLIRHIAKAQSENDEEQIHQQVSTIIALVSLVSFVGTVLSMFFAPSISAFLFDGQTDKAGYVMIILMSVPCAILARIYKGILSAHRNVRAIVISQVTADVASVIVFAILTYFQGIYGAAIAFAIYQFSRMILNFYLALKSHGSDQVIPAIHRFRSSVIKQNLSFSTVSIIISPLSMITTILISRWIIGAVGLDENGIFAAAWTVSSMYLRVLYESAASYYMPVLATSADNEELKEHMDGALRLYLVGMPAMVIILSTMGETAIWLMFSKSFAASGVLLLWILPFDLLRVVSETTGLALFAKKKLFSYLGSYIFWTVCYLGIASQAIPAYGLLGVCYAYAISHSIYVCLQLLLAYVNFGYVPSRQTRWVIARGFLIAVIASLWVGYFPSIPSRIAALLFCLASWGFLSKGSPELKLIAAALKKKFLPK